MENRCSILPLICWIIVSIEKDQIIKDSIPGIAATYYTYDAEGRVISTRQFGRTTTYSYDTKGRLLSTRDPIGRKDSTFYDNAGRVVRQVFPAPDGVGASGNQVLYNYDANGNMIGLTPPGKPAHRFAYDRDNKPIAYIPPILDGDTTETKYEYDLEGRLKQTVYPDSTFLAVTYDPIDGKYRAIATERGTTSFMYDSTSGNLKRIIGASGDTLLYAYDGSLLLSEETRGEVRGKVSATYNNNFRVVTETINNVDNVNIAYDRDDNLMRVGAYAVRRNSLNGLVTNDTVGSIVSDYTYNTAGELIGVNVKRLVPSGSSASLYTVAYTRDSLSRITVKQETIQGATQRFNYSYDIAGRLKEVRRNDTLISTYSYDANGNRLAHWTPTKTDSGSYDAQDRLLTYSKTIYFYTATGNLSMKVDTVTNDTTRYTYDAMGNLLNVQMPNGDIIEYIIDASNRRVEKKLNGQIVSRWIYNGDLKPVAELDSAGNISARFVYAQKENVPEYFVRSGVTYRIVTDHLGSPRLIVNTATGSIVGRADYDEYGNVLADSNPAFTPFGFAGGLYDVQTKLVRFGARDYDASVGRWITKDPLLFNSKEVNFFVYCKNDPINLTDISGRTTDSPIGRIFIQILKSLGIDYILENVFGIKLPPTNWEDLVITVLTGSESIDPRSQKYKYIKPRTEYRRPTTPADASSISQQPLREGPVYGVIIKNGVVMLHIFE